MLSQCVSPKSLQSLSLSHYLPKSLTLTFNFSPSSLMRGGHHSFTAHLFPCKLLCVLPNKSCVVNTHAHTQSHSKHKHRNIKPRLAPPPPLPPPQPPLCWLDINKQRVWIKTNQDASLCSLLLFGSVSSPRSLSRSHRGRMWMAWREENIIFIILWNIPNVIPPHVKAKRVTFLFRFPSVWQTLLFFFCPFLLPLTFPLFLFLCITRRNLPYGTNLVKTICVALFFYMYSFWFIVPAEKERTGCQKTPGIALKLLR